MVGQVRSRATAVSVTHGRSWTLAQGYPQPGVLGPGVSYRGFVVSSGQARRRLEVPTGFVTLVIGFGGPLQLIDALDRQPPKSMVSLVSGVQTTAHIGEHAGHLSGVEVSIPPLVAHRLFGVDMDELANEFVDPAVLLGRKAASLADRLAEAQSWAERFAILDTVLAERAEPGRLCAPEVAWAWGRLTDGTTANVAQLLTETGWSRRRMERRFREYVGVPPKAVGQIARLQRALYLQDSGVPLAQVATRAGFHDQAHLTRGIKAMTGLSPRPLTLAQAQTLRDPLVDRIAALVTTVVLAE